VALMIIQSLTLAGWLIKFASQGKLWTAFVQWAQVSLKQTGLNDFLVMTRILISNSIMRNFETFTKYNVKTENVGLYIYTYINIYIHIHVHIYIYIYTPTFLVYIYIYTHTYTYIYTYIFSIYIYIHTHTHTYIYINIYIYIHVHKNIYIYTPTFSVYIYIYIHTYTYIYNYILSICIYIYTHIHTHTYTYIYIYTPTFSVYTVGSRFATVRYLRRFTLRHPVQSNRALSTCGASLSQHKRPFSTECASGSFPVYMCFLFFYFSAVLLSLLRFFPHMTSIKKTEK
jgi:hypothetical protein